MASSRSRDAFGVLILCAGASRRMGFPKALLEWGGKSMLEHVMDLWRVAGAARIAVVFDPRIPAVVAELDRLGVMDRIANPDADEGMMSSLRAASRWSGWGDAAGRVAIALVDQPGVSTDLLIALERRSAGDPALIWQPAFAGRRGHPVFLPRAEFDRLAVCPEASLRDFIRGREEIRHSLTWDDPRIFEDLDTPVRYQAARAAAGFSE